MKDEIKEIKINKSNKSITFINNGIAFSQFGVADEILDLITNLQEIEKEHKNCTRKHWQQKCAEHCANEMIYKSRNEKAIEYIKENACWCGESCCDDLIYFECDELLNILTGGDEE